ncbi:MAG: hypothetical protein H7832_07995 [Magnetococcus sp. DMHC-6]
MNVWSVMPVVSRIMDEVSKAKADGQVTLREVLQIASKVVEQAELGDIVVYDVNRQGLKR